MKPKNYPFTSFSFLIWRFNSPDSLLSSPLLLLVEFLNLSLPKNLLLPQHHIH